MGLFRRRREEETLHEQLLREAGLAQPDEQAEPEADEQTEPEAEPQLEPAERFDPITGTTPEWDVARPVEGDAFATVHAPEIAGDAVEFVTLPDGDVIVDVEQGDAALSPLAEAVEQQLKPPYRASGRREDGDLWAVAARAIDVRRFACRLGDDLLAVCRDGERTLQAEGVPTSGWIPELQRAGEAMSPDYVVEATRLDGDLWEVRASAL